MRFRHADMILISRFADYFRLTSMIPHIITTRPIHGFQEGTSSINQYPNHIEISTSIHLAMIETYPT